MKIANIVTNAVLAVAVVVLFVLHFSGGEKSELHEGEAASVSMSSPGEISIAYFNMDSVMSNWDLYYSYQQELAQSQSELEAEFAGKSEAFSQRVQDAQYKIQRQLVTRAEAEQLQKQLSAEEQKLMALQNKYGADLQEQGLVKNRQMMDMIERYISKLSKENGYSYVYSYQFGGNLIYGAKSYDITSQVVAGLNKTYITGTETD